MYNGTIRIGACCLALAVLVLMAGCSGDSDSDSSEDTAVVQTTSSTGQDAVQIFPNPAYSNNQLEVKLPVDGSRSPSDYVYEWRRNGGAIAGVDGPVLGPESFGRGDEVSVVVVPRDASDDASQKRTASVRIHNSPPKLTGAVTIMGAAGTPEIVVSPVSRDVDNDNISYSYRWFSNGMPIPNQTGASLDPSLVEKGDRVHAEIVASDGQSSSPPVNSDPLTVENHAPRISSTPPNPGPQDEVYRYQIEAADVDQDRLTYELVAGPPGMSIDASGNLTWPMPAPADRLGQHNIQIKVTDVSGGSAVQEFNLSFVRR